MNRYTKFSLFVPICFFLATSQKAWCQSELLDIPLPIEAKIELISKDIRQNGSRMKIAKFYSSRPLDSVVNFYKTQWHSKGNLPGYLEDKLDQWVIISQLIDDKNVVLQLRTSNENRTEGYLSIAILNSNREQAKTEFPLQDGSETFSKSTSDVDGKDVETQVLLTPQGVSDTVNFYKSRLQNMGWKLGRASSFQGSETLVFNRGADFCELAISRLNHASTVIFLNRVKPHG